MIRLRYRNTMADRSCGRIPHTDEYYERLRYETDALGVYRLIPNQRLPHVTINELGFRGEKFRGGESILVLGDSVTFGVGASSDDARFSRFVETYLGEAIADASIRAYRVSQQFAQVPRLLGLLPKTKLVVLWCGYTDLLFWAITGGRIEGAFQFQAEYGARRDVRSLLAVARRAWGRVGGRSRPGDGRAELAAQPTGTLQELIEHVMLYVAAMRDLCATRAIELLVLIQPFVRGRPLDVELRALADEYDRKTQRKCGIGWYETAPRFAKLLRETLVVRESVQCVDCQSLVVESDFLDQVHLSEDGIERIAKELVQAGVIRTTRTADAVSSR